MGWDGQGHLVRSDGTRMGLNVWDAARQAGVLVNSTDTDVHANDLASSIENCIARTGENSPLADLPMGGNKHLAVGDAELRNEYCTYGQLLDQNQQFVEPSGVGGTGNALEITPAPAITAHTVGGGFSFFVSAENTGPVTVSVSGLAAVSVIGATGEALVSGDLSVGNNLRLIWDGTAYRSNVYPSPASVTPFDLHDHVPIQATSLSRMDHLLISDESVTGDPNRHTTLNLLLSWLEDRLDLDAGRLVSGTLVTARLASGGDAAQVLTRTAAGMSWQDATGAGSFHLSTDVAALLGSLDSVDRLLVADASVTGLPNRYSTVGSLRGWLEDRLDLDAGRLVSGTLATGRLAAGGATGQVLTRTAAGMSWQVATAGGSFHLGTDVTAQLGSLSGSDRMVVADVSQAGAPNRYVTLSNLRNYMRSSPLNADTVDGFSLVSGTQAEYDALAFPDPNTLYLIT